MPQRIGGYRTLTSSGRRERISLGSLRPTTNVSKEAQISASATERFVVFTRSNAYWLFSYPRSNSRIGRFTHGPGFSVSRSLTRSGISSTRFGPLARTLTSVAIFAPAVG